MSYKKIEESKIHAIEEMLAKGISKMSIARELKLNYQHLNRAINLGGIPFSSETYYASVNEYHSGIAEVMRESKSKQQELPKSTEPVTADNAVRIVVDNGYQAPKGPFKYTFEETNSLQQFQVKKLDTQELKRMYEADEAPFPTRGLIKHDSDILDRWCFNANHVLTLEDAKRAIEADYYALEIFHSYGLATPDMVDYMNSIA